MNPIVQTPAKDSGTDPEAQSRDGHVLTLDEILTLSGEQRLSAEEAIQFGLLRTELGESIYALAWHCLTSLPCPTPEGKGRWDALLQHRTTLQARLGRTVALQVAALDLLYSKADTDQRVVLLAEDTYHKLLLDGRYDPITGLSTRRSFDGAYQHELNRARRYRKNLTLVLVEVDDIDALRSRFGDDRCEAMLRELGGMVARSIRSTDTAARLDSSKFGLLLAECRVKDGTQHAERLRRRVLTHDFTGSGQNTPALTLSLGVAGFPRNSADGTSLMDAARATLYRAQELGGNQVAYD